MDERTSKIVVFGSTPFALVLAGLLAADHSRAVVLVADPARSTRLAGGVDLSIGLHTRPDTLALLAATTGETVRWLGRIGGNALLERADALLVATAPATLDAIGHLRHVAGGYGHRADRLAGHPFGPGRAVLIRKEWRLRREAFWPASEAWLAQSGVEILAPNDFAARDPADIGVVVLADDEAVIDGLDEAALAAIGTPLPQQRLLTEPVRSLPHRLVVDCDQGLTLHQRPTGAVDAAIAAPPARARDVLAGALGAVQPVIRLAGAGTGRTLATHDGAIAVGAIEEGAIFYVAGLGMAGLFLAPAVARLVAGTPTPEEAAWAESRQPAAAARRLAEFAPLPAMAS